MSIRLIVLPLSITLHLRYAIEVYSIQMIFFILPLQTMHKLFYISIVTGIGPPCKYNADPLLSDAGWRGRINIGIILGSSLSLSYWPVLPRLDEYVCSGSNLH